MTHIARDRIGIVWLFLVTATILTWWLGRGHGLAAVAPAVTNISIIAVATIKLRLIGLYFMELRTAPTQFRMLFEGIVAGLFVVLAVLLMF